MVGKSRNAAHKAVMQTCISRYVLCIPLFMPAACLLAVDKMKMMPRSFGMRTALELFFIFAELYFAVPLAIAMYPQFGRLRPDEVEVEF